MADENGKPDVSENPTPEDLEKLRAYLEEVRSTRIEMEQEAQVNSDDELRKVEAARLEQEIAFELNAARIAHGQLNPPENKEEDYTPPPSNNSQYLDLGNSGTSDNPPAEDDDDDTGSEGN